jgi:hypothetical protein
MVELPPPVAAARIGVDLTVRCLAVRDRRRYRAEFLADLSGLSPSAQRRYAVGVLSQVFALRAALGAAHVEEDPMGTMVTSTRWQRFRCHVLHWHHWARMSNPDGERYLGCTVCGTDAPPPPHWEAGGVYGGGGGFA